MKMMTSVLATLLTVSSVAAFANAYAPGTATAPLNNDVSSATMNDGSATQQQMNSDTAQMNRDAAQMNNDAQNMQNDATGMGNNMPANDGAMNPAPAPQY